MLGERICKMKIKKGLNRKYAAYCKINMDGGYSQCVIEATESVGSLLDGGASPERALWDGVRGFGITGFQSGCLAQAISYYHPRGNEFRIWFNKEHGVDEEKAKGGIVNPAMFTIG